MKNRMSGEKKRRVCSEWRKARSREAARGRREQEGALFGELWRGLPMPQSVVAHLDKASVIRLTLSYLHLRALLSTPDCVPNTARCTLEETQSDTAAGGCESEGTSLGEMVLESAFEGFLLLLSGSGQVIYTTEAISIYTGIKQVDMIGQSLYDFMHPCDQQEAREILSSKSGVEECQKYDLFFRIRITSTPQRRNVNLKSATWKVIHCTGVRKPAMPGRSSWLLLLCQSLPVSMSIAWDTNLNHSAFLSKHSPDMRFTYCQPSVFQLTGYTETDLLGHSVYQYYHASDCQHVHKAHLSLFSKGQTSTGKYRLLVKHGGYVWVETLASVVYNSHTGQLQSVVCINYVLSEVEQSAVVLSLEQMECLLKPCSLGPTPGTPLLQQGAALLAELSQQAAVPTDPCGNATPAESAWTPGYENQPSDTAEKDGFTCHDTDDMSEMLLEWKCDADLQPTPQVHQTDPHKRDDLETLAPYIQMDGEDFLLFPFSDMEGVELEEQGSLYAFPLTFPNLEIQRPVAPLLHLTHTWPPMTSPMTSETPAGYCSPCSFNHAHTPLKEHGIDSECVCRLRSRQEWWQALKKYRADMNLSTEPHSEHRPPLWPPLEGGKSGIPIIPHWKMAKVADSCTNYASCWWSPDGLVCHCGSVPWAAGHTDLPIHSRDQHHPIRDPHRTVLVRCASVLPVLSRWECEVNAPLEPSSCLLRGSEILSVLDQAMSRLPP